MKPTSDEETTERFRTFVSQARILLRRSPEREAFQRFLDEAYPVVIQPIKMMLSNRGFALQNAATNWVTNVDLLEIAGLSWVEDSYTELLSWALSPELHPESAIERQQTWISSLGVEDAIRFAAKPRTQFATPDGTPDLVLKYDNMIIVVEVKTGTEEHFTPSGEYQTVAYPESVRKKYQLSSACPVHVVLMSPDGRSPVNPEAIRTTFASFALTMSGVLDHYVLPGDLRFALANVITHFLRCAVPPDVNQFFRKQRRTFKEILEVNTGEQVDDVAIIQNLHVYAYLEQSLRGAA